MCCSEEPCVLNYNASDYAVRIGDHDLNTIGDTPVEKTIMVQKLIHHPFFSNYSCNGPYDLTILELSEPVDLNIYTPACLAQTGEYLRFEGKEATVAGWGTLYSNGPMPSNPYAPREVKVPILTQKQCQKLEQEVEIVPNMTIMINNQTQPLYTGRQDLYQQFCLKNTYFLSSVNFEL